MMDRVDENLASRGTRFAAVLLDNVLGLAALIPGGIAVAVAANTYQGEDGAFIFLVLCFLGFLGVQIYLLVTKGQTIGKMILGIQIVDVDDDTLVGAGRIIGLRGLLPGVIFSIPYLGWVFALGNVLFIFGRRRRCLHDHIASTKVVQSKIAEASTGNAVESSTETTLRESTTQTELHPQGHYGLESRQESCGYASTMDEEAPVASTVEAPSASDSTGLPERSEAERSTDSLHLQKPVEQRPNRFRDISTQEGSSSRTKLHNSGQTPLTSLKESYKGHMDLGATHEMESADSNVDETDEEKEAVSNEQDEQAESQMGTKQDAEPSQSLKDNTNTLICEVYLEWCHSAGVMVDRYYMFERKLRKVIADAKVRPIYRDKRADGIRLRHNVDNISDEFWLVETGQYRAVFPQPRDGNHFRTLAPLFDANGAANPKSLSAVHPADVDLDGTSYQLKSQGTVQ